MTTVQIGKNLETFQRMNFVIQCAVNLLLQIDVRQMYRQLYCTNAFEALHIDDDDGGTTTTTKHLHKL